jgi:urease accessory protein
MHRNGPVRTRLLAATAGAIAVALASAAPAGAHTGRGLHGLGDGALHPILGLDHLLAMVAVGVVAATGLRSRRAWVAPAAFLGGMLAGGVAGLAGLPLPGAEHLVVASIVLLGLVVAGALRHEARWVVPALVVAGLAHGHAHGAEAPTSAHPALYVAGFLAATALLHVIGLAAGSTVRDRQLVRVGYGVATATAGALLLL